MRGTRLCREASESQAGGGARVTHKADCWLTCPMSLHKLLCDQEVRGEPIRTTTVEADVEPTAVKEGLRNRSEARS